MGARQKLNTVSTAGALVIGGLIGTLAKSWPVFLLTTGVLLGAAMYAGDIRLTGRSS